MSASRRRSQPPAEWKLRELDTSRPPPALASISDEAVKVAQSSVQEGDGGGAVVPLSEVVPFASVPLAACCTESKGNWRAKTAEEDWTKKSGVSDSLV